MRFLFILMVLFAQVAVGHAAWSSFDPNKPADTRRWDKSDDDIRTNWTALWEFLKSPTDSYFVVGDGTNWTTETGATLRTSIGVAIGSDVQAWDDDLDDIAALTPTDGYNIVGDGTGWQVQAKPVFDARDSGATGDGTTDDTAALQACLTAAVDANGVCYIPAGTYKITTALAPASNFNGLVVRGDPGAVTQIVQTTADANGFTFGSADGTTIVGSRITVENLTIGTVSGAGNGIVLYPGVSRSLFNNILIPDAGNACFQLNGNIICTFINCRADGGASSSFPWLNGLTGGVQQTYGWEALYDTGTAKGVNACEWIGCSGSSGTYGFYMDGNNGDESSVIYGGEWEGNQGYDIYLFECNGFSVQDAYSEPTYDANGVTLEDCWGCTVDLTAGTIHFVDSISCEAKGHAVANFDANCEHCIDSTNVKFGASGLRQIDESNTTIINRFGAHRFADTTAEAIFGIADRGYLINSNNCGLEEWTASTLPLGWSEQDGGANVTITQEAAIVHGGSSAAKVVVASSGAYEGLKYSIPADYLGQWICVEAWVRVDGPAATTGRPAVSLVWDTGSSPMEAESSYLTDDTWFKWTSSFYPTTAAFANAYLLIGNRTTSSITMYIDDVRIWSQWNPYDNWDYPAADHARHMYDQNGDTYFEVRNDTDGTASETGYLITYPGGTSELKGLANSFTTSAQYRADSTILEALNATNGLILSSSINAPVEIWTNGVQRAVFNATASDFDVVTEGGNDVYNSTEVPGGELGGTWASPTIDDGLAVTNWTLTTPDIGVATGTSIALGNPDVTTIGAFEASNDGAAAQIMVQNRSAVGSTDETQSIWFRTSNRNAGLIESYRIGDQSSAALSDSGIKIYVANNNANTLAMTIDNDLAVDFPGTTINMTTAGTTLTVGTGVDNGTVSAGVFVDRTKFYEGDALGELMKVHSVDGQIDHSSLPDFTQVHLPNGTIERDLGATVSMLVVALQQQQKTIEALQRQLNKE